MHQNDLTQPRSLPLIDGDLELALLSQVPVLIAGNNRVDRLAYARFIHDTRARQRPRFVAACCHPGAQRLEGWDYVGDGTGQDVTALTALFARARGGTLFVDDLEFMQPDLQCALSAALDHDESVDAGVSLRQDVRLITGAMREWLVNTGRRRFDERLFYRLNIMRLECAMVPFGVPPLGSAKVPSARRTPAELVQDAVLPVSPRLL
jgi:transcriptional activator for dhaKLM operon